MTECNQNGWFELAFQEKLVPMCRMHNAMVLAEELSENVGSSNIPKQINDYAKDHDSD